MKASLVIAWLAVLLSFQSGAQAPPGINYQGVARDTDGKPVASKSLSVRISVLKNSATGDVEYAEVHQVTTNQFGLFTLVIGKGTPKTGSFAFVSWAIGNKWLQIEMDVNGGNSFQVMGSQELMSVPYSFYSQYSGNGLQAGQGISITNGIVNNTGDADNSPTNEVISGVSLGQDNKLSITDAGGTHVTDLSPLIGGSQDLSHVLTAGNNAGAQKITNLAAPAGATDAATKSYVDAHHDPDADPANEIQDLSLASNVLKISNNSAATPINLTPYLDNTDSQNLSLGASAGTNRTINLSGGTSATFDVADNDNNPTNEAQTLLKVSNVISLSTVSGAGGGSVVLNDDDPVNEIQDLTLTSNILKINKNAAATAINLSPYLDNTDNQTLSYNTVNNNLTISSGNTVAITQTLNQVLTQGNDAGAKKITNLASPTLVADATTKKYVDDADAALGALISTTYAFKTAFSYTNTGALVESNRTIPFTTEEFDDFNVLATNSFTAVTNGIYVFTVDGTYAAGSAGGQLSLLFNGIKYPISIVQPWGGVFPRFNATFMFKLTAGQTVSLVGDNILVSGQFTGSFYGHKL